MAVFLGVVLFAFANPSSGFNGFPSPDLIIWLDRQSLVRHHDAPEGRKTRILRPELVILQGQIQGGAGGEKTVQPTSALSLLGRFDFTGGSFTFPRLQLDQLADPAPTSPEVQLIHPTCFCFYPKLKESAPAWADEPTRDRICLEKNGPRGQNRMSSGLRVPGVY